MKNKGVKGLKIITILTALKFCLKMLTYRKYAPLFAQNSALSKFNSFQNWFVPLKGMIIKMEKSIIDIINKKSKELPEKELFVDNKRRVTYKEFAEN